MQSRLSLHVSSVRTFRFLVRVNPLKGNRIYLIVQGRKSFSIFFTSGRELYLPARLWYSPSVSELQLPLSCVFLWDPSTGASASPINNIAYLILWC